MINLNDKRYLPNEKITKEDILSKYTEEEIFKHYIGEFTLGEPIRSPIRSGDDTPSFNIFYSKRHNCLLFKDFAGKRGDFVKLVQELLGISSYQDAIDRIYGDMMSSMPVAVKKADTSPPIGKNGYTINIITRSWEERDLNYWRQYGISFSTLRIFNVLPIAGYFHNQYHVKTDDIAYAYLEYKDEKLTFKIYRPTASKRNKWRNNNPYGVHQGYMQLPKYGSVMIITKSLKDVMSLYEVAGIPSIGVQSETCFIKDTVIEEYRDRFKKLYTLFDNDRQGKEQAESYKKMYDIEPIFIPDTYKVKDFSDLVKTVGIYNAEAVIRILVEL